MFSVFLAKYVICVATLNMNLSDRQTRIITLAVKFSKLLQSTGTSAGSIIPAKMCQLNTIVGQKGSALGVWKV